MKNSNDDIQKGAAYIVTSYAKKLQNEQAWRSGPGVGAPPPQATSGPKYTNVQEEDHIPLTGPHHNYPYSDTNHSFGAEAHRTTASV